MDALERQQVSVLSALREAVEERREQQERIRALVLAAREHGVSWASIGNVLGMSKQSAWEQYARDDGTQR